MNKEPSKFNVIPIFPTALGGIVLNEDLTSFEKIKLESFTNLTSDESYNSFKTSDNQILQKFPKEKNIIMNYFNNFKNEVLKLSDNSFEIASSWATKVEQNGFCQYHDHKNSFYSAVLYLDSVTEGGEIQFQNPVQTTSFLLNPVEWNMLNYETYFLTPEKNLLLFFPSYLKHRINKYRGNQPRYSIAMNFVPVGKFGRGDSVVHYNLIS